MAEIIQEEKQKGGKKRPKKHSTHIDMTPMVDLMCLLITFFMLTTSFNKPKVMEIILPEKVQKNEKVEPPKIADSRTLNIILARMTKYSGIPGKLIQTTWFHFRKLILVQLASGRYYSTGTALSS